MNKKKVLPLYHKTDHYNKNTGIYAIVNACCRSLYKENRLWWMDFYLFISLNDTLLLLGGDDSLIYSLASIEFKADTMRSSSNGFTTKSHAPLRSAACNASRWSIAEIITTFAFLS